MKPILEHSKSLEDSIRENYGSGAVKQLENFKMDIEGNLQWGKVGNEETHYVLKAPRILGYSIQDVDTDITVTRNQYGKYRNVEKVYLSVGIINFRFEMR